MAIFKHIVFLQMPVDVEKHHRCATEVQQRVVRSCEMQGCAEWMEYHVEITLLHVMIAYIHSSYIKHTLENP